MRDFLLGIICLLGIQSFLNAQSHPDCINPFPVCEKISYHFEDLNSSGSSEDIISNLRCTSENFEEMNSHWMKFSIQEAGTLTFSINPEKENHDIDFILFQAENFSCESLEEIRCMATGQSMGSTNTDDINCLGSTGLRMASSDEFEYFGCKLGDDNYLKFLQANENEEYILFINDYHTNGAISVTFEGTAKLKMLEDCELTDGLKDLQISSIYPNPANDFITIEFNSTENQSYQIDILDMQSKVFSSLTNKAQEVREIDVKSLPSGPYIIRIKQGRRVAVKQFVKI